MSTYDPRKAVTSPHHTINPGQVSSSYTVEALHGDLPVELNSYDQELLAAHLRTGH